MARILEDSKQMSEVNKKVSAILAVVPDCSEEQIHLALHDNGYDVDKAMSALLDSNGLANEVYQCMDGYCGSSNCSTPQCGRLWRPCLNFHVCVCVCLVQN